jgi:putative oxidoreductase
VTTPRSKVLHIALWVAQVLLALFFLSSGLGRALMPIHKMAAAPNMAWSAAVPAALLRFIGIAEAIGAVGLVLPAATRIKPGLTPLSAAGLLLVMVLAAGFHVMRNETVVFNLVFGAVAAFIAWGRWKKAPIAPRQQT